MWIPKYRSDKNIQTRGRNKAHRLLVKWKPVNKAILVIGAKLGGCGNSLVNRAKTTKPKTTFISFPFNPMVDVFCKTIQFILLGQIHFTSGIQIVKSIFFQTVNKKDTFPCTFHLGSELLVDIRKFIKGKYRLFDGISF